MNITVNKIGYNDSTPLHVQNEHPAIFRQNVWRNTRQIGHNYPYGNTEKIAHNSLQIPTGNRARFNTIIEVVNNDTINAGKLLKDAGYNPALLNFADNLIAGGSVDVGSGAQEESLWRRTNLFCTQLQDDFYPISELPSQEGLYTSFATVFKETEKNRCVMLKEPFRMAFIAVPGLRNPQLTDRGVFSKQDDEKLANKIELIFQIAFAKGHDSIVLGALGCGAWRNPPRLVAEKFKQMCAKYHGVFRRLTFACLDMNESGYTTGGTRSNFVIFNEILPGI